jgi:DnaJ homolog subfamily B member 13
MSKNYYDILGLSSNCNETDIIVAYRKLAIENHPRNSLSKDLHRFHEIAEAYEVLSDKKYRQSYDKFGEFGLKEGVPNGSGGFNGGYRYIGNSFEIFEKFFGSSNPFFSAFSESSSLRNFGIDNIVAKKSEEVPSDLIVEVFCTLEELYNGCKKVLSYSSLHLNADGKTSRAESHEKTIEIPKGSSQETIISFKGEGNEYKNHVTTNLVFKIIEIPHENFSRKGNDLIYYFKISLIDALAALPMRLVKYN